MNCPCPKVVLTLLLFPPFLFITASKTYAKEWVVNGGDSIQDAIDAAADGDVIKVGPGEYYESLTVLLTNPFPREIILEGSGMEKTFIFGTERPIMLVGGPFGGIEVFGFAFECSDRIHPNEVVLDHVPDAFFHDNHITSCYTGVKSYFSSIRLENNVFSSNLTGGVTAFDSETSFLNNTFYRNAGCGAFLGISPDVFVRNIVAGSGIGLLIGSSNGEIQFNNFWNNGADAIGVTLDDTSTFVDPLFQNPNFRLQEASPLIDAGGFEEREEDGTRVDLGFEGRATREISSLEDFPWLFSKIQFFTEAGEDKLTRSRLFKPLINKLLAVEDLILEGELRDASKKITHDLMPKFDSQDKNSWAEDTPWRRRFHLLLSDLVTLLELE